MLSSPHTCKQLWFRVTYERIPDERIPVKLSDQQLEHLLQLESRRDRIYRLLVWGSRDLRHARAKENSTDGDGGTGYDVLSKSIMLFKRMPDLHRSRDDWKLATVTCLPETPRIVLDLKPLLTCDPSKSTVLHRECRRIAAGISQNRKHRTPGRLFLSNVPWNRSDPTYPCWEMLQRHLDGFSLKEGLAYEVWHGDPLFAGREVVYLNHRSRATMDTLDSDAVHVISASNVLAPAAWVTGRAKSLRVRQCSMPINKHVG